MAKSSITPANSSTVSLWGIIASTCVCVAPMSSLSRCHHVTARKRGESAEPVAFHWLRAAGRQRSGVTPASIWGYWFDWIIPPVLYQVPLAILLFYILCFLFRQTPTCSQCLDLQLTDGKITGCFWCQVLLMVPCQPSTMLWFWLLVQFLLCCF